MPKTQSAARALRGSRANSAKASSVAGQQTPASSLRQTLATYDVSAPKKAANVSINTDLLSQAKELGLNLSQTLEEGLVSTIRAEKQRRWLQDNKEAIEAYRQHVEENGVWSDGIRLF